jgi:alpha-ketoglutarate-dependent taurine dioxygenase
VPQNPSDLPLVYVFDVLLSDTPDLMEFTSTRRGEIFDRLLERGAVLFRGFTRSGNDGSLAELAASLGGGELFDYAGGASPRSSLGNGVYTSTEYPSNLELPLHNELSYCSVFPRYLFFECIIAPETGGETTLGSSRSILERMPPNIVSELKNKGIRYDRHLHGTPGDGYSWQEAFATDSRKKALLHCELSGAEAGFLADGTLRISQRRPATLEHPVTGEEVWFNQAAGFHSSNIDAETRAALVDRGMLPRLEARFGDGSAIPDEIIEDVRTVLRHEAESHAWNEGDVLMIDNILAAHGRMSFAGSRLITLAMA